MADGTLDALPFPITSTPTSGSFRPKIRITTPSSVTPATLSLTPNKCVNPADPQSVQYNIYLELVKLNANARIRNSAPVTPSYPPYTSRRYAFWSPAQPTTAPASAHKSDLIDVNDGAKFDALGHQFTTLVIISTFTANLIIAFLSLAHNFISGRQDIYAYGIIVEMGEFLALVGMAIHAGVIIIAGKCAALDLKHAKKFTAKLNNEQSELEREEVSKVKCEMPDEKDNERKAKALDHLASSMATKEQSPITAKTTITTQTVVQSNISPSLYGLKTGFPSLSSFHQFLTVCETLQLLGTTFFFLGVTVLIFFIFLHCIFPILLVVGCVIGSCALGWLVGFWEISASKQLLRVVRRWMFDLGTCGGGRRSQRKKNDIYESDLEKGEATKNV